MNSLTSSKAKSFKGTLRVPGDKSISHRSMMMGAMAKGKTTVSGLLEGEDVLSTAKAMQKLGAFIEKKGDIWEVTGCGLSGFSEPETFLDMGNAGTGARLLMGILSGCPFTSFLTGDESLCRRPMQRVISPLEEMGASFVSRSESRLPLAVIGKQRLYPITYEMPVASAQVKSAVLFGGLKAGGTTTVIETKPTRDHTERMLKGFGCEVVSEKIEKGKTAISIKGGQELKACDIVVPADWSSAAFPAVAALIVPDSEILLPEVGMNPLRFGLYEVLKEMGADLALENVREIAGEPVCDVRAKTSFLKGIDVPPEIVPSMIDEFPILAVAAAFAEGETRMTGIGELRVKESDRLKAMAEGLSACGVKVKEEKDALTVYGSGRIPEGNTIINVNLDHRIAMAFLVLGMNSEKPIAVDDVSSVATSFPGFAEMMSMSGADFYKKEG